MLAGSMHVLFLLCGLFLIGLAVSKMLSPPERGRPDSLNLYLNHYFACCGILLVGLVFTALSVAALFFDYPVSVAPWQQFAQAALLALAANVLLFTWRRTRKRRRS